MAVFSERMVPERVQVFWAALQRGEFITDAAAEAGTAPLLMATDLARAVSWSLSFPVDLPRVVVLGGSAALAVAACHTWW